MDPDTLNDLAGVPGKIMGLYVRLYAVGYNVNVLWESGVIQKLFWSITEKFNYEYMATVE